MLKAEKGNYTDVLNFFKKVSLTQTHLLSRALHLILVLVNILPDFYSMCTHIGSLILTNGTMFYVIFYNFVFSLNTVL